MGGIDGAAEAKEARWVQRQACMSIRNIVVRSPDLRPVVLGKVRGPSATHCSLAAVQSSKPCLCGVDVFISLEYRV